MSLSKPDCKICSSLKPKIEKMLKDFSNLKLISVNLELIPDAAEIYSVTNLPTIILYAMGKEVYRTDRGHDVDEIKNKIEKYNKILFV